jgi:GH15 family glucan-1,4-alpha-glucosidase
LARQHRVAEARAVFEQVMARASDVGLLSEQIWPDTGALLGNYQQAFTHLALIRAAISIARAETEQDA